jgi:phage terminase small subunit
MSKSTAFVIGALALCLGLFASLLIMSSDVENFKNEKIQADIAKKKAESEQKRILETQEGLRAELNKANYSKDELVKEVVALKEKLSETKKENVNDNSPLREGNTTVDGEKQWKEVARWTGKGAKTTETFHISSNTWRISWSTRLEKNAEYSPGLLQICVYNPDNSLVNIAANVMVKSEDIDSSVMHSSGDYYLSINAAQPYIVIVETK